MTELSYPHCTVDAMLAASAASYPSRIAVRDGSRRLTYRGLERLVARWAAVLGEYLNRPGTVVALTSVLSPDFVVGYYGILRSGNVAAPVNPFLREEQLVHVLSDSGAEVALVDSGTAARLVTVRDRLPRLRHIVSIDEGAGDRPAGVQTLREVLARTGVRRHRASPPAVDPESLACLHFTSGTTGLPKTVMLSHRNVVANAAQIADAHQLSGNAVALNHLPTFHAMHMNSAIFVGGTQVLCRAKEAAVSVALANSYGATHYYSLPVRLAALAGSPDLPALAFETVQLIASGGAALPPEAARRLAEHFRIPVIQGYGLAETAPLTHSDRANDWQPGTVGRPVADTECRIVDVETRQPLAAGTTGEVQVRGPQLMLGYAGDDKPAIDAEGWFSTGDVGRVDGTGRLTLVDRIKDVFKRENWLVAPSEIEQVLRQHPEVRECVVVDVTDEFGDGHATAFVVPALGERPGLAGTIAAEVNAGLAFYQRIEHIELVAEIERSPNGKVPRRLLRERMARIVRGGGETTVRTPTQGVNGMVTFITTFTLKGDGAEEFEALFEKYAAFMASQPGFVDYQLVRSLSAPGTYVNIGRWQEAANHKAVTASPQFRAHVGQLAPLVTVQADLFRTVAASVSA